MLVSGGLDSAACLHFMLAQGLRVDGVFIDYGQAAGASESRAAQGVANYLGVPLRSYTFSSDDVLGAGEVLGRNAFLITSAVLVARHPSGLLAIATHAGTSYYDCSEAFISTMGRIVSECTGGKLNLVAPFSDWSKRDVFDYLTASSFPASITYSCEAQSEVPCNECASCADRRLLGC